MTNRPLDNEKEIPPIEELKNFTIDEDPEFPNRVKRSLNRHLLVGDSLEFSLDIFQKTMWEYLKSMFEAWPLSADDKPEQK